ncbi:MAG: DHH family phosphoesterase [Longimicrobiales bacterium]
MPPRLIIISDQPQLFERVELPGRTVYRWDPEGARDAPRATLRARAASDWYEFSGKPTDPTTYRALLPDRGSDSVALIHLRDPRRAARVAKAVHAAHGDVALLVLCGPETPVLPEGAVARSVGWSDFLRVDLQAELRLLETERRITSLRRFAAGVRILPVLVQADPDPDAMASALAVRTLLRRRAGTMPIVTLGGLSRPENRRMAQLLRFQVTKVTHEELEAFDKVIAVDMQPLMLRAASCELAVIDHHPPDRELRSCVGDIRPSYGATATILTEYLRSDDERRIGRRLATALLYGIKTDTATLGRGATSADVLAYAFLQERADSELLHRIERPSYTERMARGFGQALANLALDEDFAVALMPPLGADDTHLLADLADFLISMEGVRWAAAAAPAGNELIIKIRHTGEEPGAGALARALADRAGTGGGHRSMAQLIVDLAKRGTPAAWRNLASADALLALLRDALSALPRAEDGQDGRRPKSRMKRPRARSTRAARR